MSKFSTLIQDIYSIFDKPHELSEDDLEIFAENIKESLRDTFEKRQDRGEKKLRLSKIGLPSRRLWFDLKSKPTIGGGKPSDQIRFLFGHLLEQLVLLLIKEAGHTITDEQSKVVVNGVPGKKDCKVDGVTVDIKSASSFSFRKFKSGEFLLDEEDSDAFGYKHQIASYASKDAEDLAGFIVINKESGELCSVLLESQDFPDINLKIEQEKINLERDTPPPEKCYRPVKYGKSGNEVIHKLCTFCDHKFKCWEDSNSGKGLISHKYSSGSVWFNKLVKNPREKKEYEEEEPSDDNTSSVA